MTENYIYAPEHNIEGGFRCKVPLPGSRQIFMIDGGVQGTGRPLDIRFEKGKIYEESLQVISIRTESTRRISAPGHPSTSGKAAAHG